MDLDTGLYYFRKRYYHVQLGEFCLRDPLRYFDGPSLYAASFVPNGTDPNGLKKCSCDDFVAKITELFGNPLAVDGEKIGDGSPTGKRCDVTVKCLPDCSNKPGAAYPPDGKDILLCISNKGITEEKDFWTVFEHEWQHAKNFCRPGFSGYKNCHMCETYEKRAHEVNCKLIYSDVESKEFSDCVKCGVWASCNSPAYCADDYKAQVDKGEKPPGPCNWDVLGTPSIGAGGVFPFPKAKP